MPDTPDDAVTTIAFGAAGHYAERASHASLSKAPRHHPILDVVIACSSDRIIRAKELLIQHPIAVQQIARQYATDLMIVATPEMMEDRTIERPFAGGVATSENPRFFPDLLEAASGAALIRAIHGAIHGYPVGEGETLPLVGDDDERGITDSAEVLDVLRAAGIQAIRFTEHLERPFEGEGQFWHVLDEQIVRRPTAAAHFTLDFANYPTAEASQAADALNREWFVLDAEAREVVQKVVGICRRDGGRITHAFRDGEVVAYPNLRNGISWDVDDGQGTLARGVQCLPSDAEPRIGDVGELRTIAASWDQLSDVISEAKDPTRARDLLKASAWHLKAIEDWQSAQVDTGAELLANLNGSILASIDHSQAIGKISADHTDHLRRWTDSETPSATPMQAEEQAALTILADRHRQLRAAVTANSDGAAWLKSFDTAGWPNVAERTVADTLSAFLHELFVIHETHARETPAQHDAPAPDRGRNR